MRTPPLTPILAAIALAAPAHAAPDPNAKPPTSIDPSEWLGARGAAKPALDKLAEWSLACDEEIVIGPAHEPALRCYRHEDVSKKTRSDIVYRVVGHGFVLAVRAHKIVPALDAQVRIDMLDARPPTLPGGHTEPMFELELGLAADGMSATLSQKSGSTGCEDAKAPLKSKQGEAPDDWAVFDRSLVTGLCDARGTYTWKGDRFQRARR